MVTIHTEIRSSGQGSGLSSSSGQLPTSTSVSGFPPRKQTLKWRLACRELVRECPQDQDLRRKGRKQDWAEGKVQLPFNVIKGLSGPSGEALKLGWPFRIVLS